MHRTCASCRQRQAQPFRVLGRNVPAQPSGSAQRPSPGTASPSLLGSVPRTPGGTAASGTRPGFILGCGPSRPASRHPARNTHRQPPTNHNRQSKIHGFRQSRMPIFRQSRVPGFWKSRMPSSEISSSSSKRPKSVPKASQTPSFAPHPQTPPHSSNRTPLASPCPKEIFRCQIPFPKTQPQTYCRACSVRKIFFSVQKSAFYACKNRVNFRDKVNGISPHKKHHHRGRRIWTETLCRFSPAVSKRSPVSRSAPALSYTSVTVGPLRSGQSGYLHCGTPVPVPRSNANSAPCSAEGSSAGLSSCRGNPQRVITSTLRYGRSPRLTLWATSLHYALQLAS